MTLQRSKIFHFRHDEQGAVAIIFGLSATVLMLGAGLAVDYSRVLDMRSAITAAADAASLAAGRAMLDGKLSDSAIQTLAKAYFDQNVGLARRMGTINPPDIIIDRSIGKVTINVDAKTAMTIAKIGGYKEMPIPVTSTAVYQMSDIEVGMALDITGSMACPPGTTGAIQCAAGLSNSKIAALKGAFKIFADTVITDNPIGGHTARIGLAPYSYSINLGPYAAAASNNRSKDGCVVERASGDFNDNSDAFFVANKITPNIDSPGINGGAWSYDCTSTPVTPLSSDKAALERTVNAFVADGSTGGHFGVQWAWNLVSDNWANVWGSGSAPASYSEVTKGKLIKAVVLMTDGAFNTAYHGGKSADQAVALCTAMKKKGIIVFSVGLGLNGADLAAVNTLQSCASPGAGYFVKADDAAQLNSAFSSFATKLTQLRISQ